MTPGIRVGSWLTRPDLGITEVMAGSKLLDWLCVDLQHNGITVEQAENQLRVIRSFGLDAFVRVGSNDAALIGRMLDLGATGIIVPMVNSAAEAQRAVSAAFYPPTGSRGVGLSTAQGHTPEGFSAYRDRVDAETKVVVQIEHRDAIGNLEGILSTPGLYGCFIGPYDLSASMGVAGQFDHPAVAAAVSNTVRVAGRHGLRCGIHVVEPSAKALRARIDEGFSFIAFSYDMLLLVRSLQRELSI